MHTELIHKSKFTFESKIRDHAFIMDAQQSAGGDNSGPTPKELMLACILGCTGMDIIAVFKKHKVSPQKLRITGDAEPRAEHPKVFTAVSITFEVDDPILTAEVLNEAARASLTKFCGVSAMVSKVVPIHYRCVLNGLDVGSGTAKFDI